MLIIREPINRKLLVDLFPTTDKVNRIIVSVVQKARLVYMWQSVHCIRDCPCRQIGNAKKKTDIEEKDKMFLMKERHVNEKKHSTIGSSLWQSSTDLSVS